MLVHFHYLTFYTQYDIINKTLNFTIMKKLVFCIIMVTVVLLSSCGLRSSSPSHGEQKKAGIEKVVTIDKRYFIINFNSKCSSNSLTMFMAKSGYMVIKTAELNSILNDLAKKEKKHAAIYKADEYSQEVSLILKKLAPVMQGLKGPAEVLAPIFHEKGGQLIADYGDFAAGWSSKGFIVVTQKNNRRN